MKCLRWLRARERRSVIVVGLVTLLGFIGFRMHQVQSSPSLIKDIALVVESEKKKITDESLIRDETFSDDQSRVSEMHHQEKSENLEVVTILESITSTLPEFSSRQTVLKIVFYVPN